MATVVLVRHGRSSANVSGVLAGRTRGVHLDDVGREQVARAGERLAPVPLAAVVTSPLERCKETAKAVLAAQASPSERPDGAALRAVTDRGLLECDYGEWQGRAIKDLAKDPLWKTVQTQPSAVTFPGGESMAGMQARVVAAVRRHDAALEAEHGPDAVWVAVSHGDLIKAVLADALGMHLDLFQRLHVDPASISVVRYTGTRPFVLATNTHAGDLGWLAPPKRKGGARSGAKGGAKGGRRRAAEDAVVGGGAGPGARS